jgi:hypothetical protein
LLTLLLELLAKYGYDAVEYSVNWCYYIS